MPSNTIFNPMNVAEFTSDVLNFAAKGVSATCNANTTTNIDYTVTDDVMVTGMQVITNGGIYGDYAKLQVIDPANVLGLGLPNGTVVKQFVDTWYLPPSSNTQFDVAYPAKLLAGLTIRIVFTSTAIIGSVFVACNYKLHKILK